MNDEIKFSNCLHYRKASQANKKKAIKVQIGDEIYESVSVASKKLRMSHGTIRAYMKDGRTLPDGRKILRLN